MVVTSLETAGTVKGPLAVSNDHRDVRARHVRAGEVDWETLTSTRGRRGVWGAERLLSGSAHCGSFSTCYRGNGHQLGAHTRTYPHTHPIRTQRKSSDNPENLPLSVMNLYLKNWKS